MAIDIHHLVLVAADLTLASVLSFAFYAFTCLCLVILASCMIFVSSFEAVKTFKRKIGLKGRAIMMSTFGTRHVKKMDKESFEILAVRPTPEFEGTHLLEKDCSSKTRMIQLPVVKEKYQAVMQTESQLSLEGKSRMMKKPSWTKAPIENKRKLSPKGENGFLSPVFLIAMLLAPVNIVCCHLKKKIYQLCTRILNSQD